MSGAHMSVPSSTALPAVLTRSRGPGSLRGELLRWLIGPLILLLIANSISVYRNAVAAANAAYDRTLLTSARVLAENLHVDNGRLALVIPYSVFDLLETDIKGRVYFRVLAPDGTFVAGWDDLPPLRTNVEMSRDYAALVRFYTDAYRDQSVRMAAMLQPVSEGGINGMATIQFAESFEARRALTREILIDALLRQGTLIVAACLLVLWAIHSAVKPFHELSRALGKRESSDLAPFDRGKVHEEVRPLVDALNSYMTRLRDLIELRKRFIANAAHQLRTPLAVLKTQAGYAGRGAQPGELREVVDAMRKTIDDAARLADQLLSLTRAEHGFAVGEPQRFDLAALAREACLDALTRARAREIDLGFEADPSGDEAAIDGDPMLVRELLANLIDNAIRYVRPGDSVTVRVARGDDGKNVRLEVADTGPGIAAAERGKVLVRFYRVPGQTASGSGLGLAIVREIAAQHQARLALADTDGGGLTVRIDFPAQRSSRPPAKNLTI